MSIVAFVPQGMTRAEAGYARMLFMQYLLRGEADYFWLPGERVITYRLAARTHKTRRMPEDAIWIGRYRHPYNARDFLRDLEQVVMGGRP